jgi:hypothetical protein
MDASTVWGITSASTLVWSAECRQIDEVCGHVEHRLPVADVPSAGNPTISSVMTMLFQMPSRLELDDSQRQSFQMLLQNAFRPNISAKMRKLNPCLFLLNLLRQLPHAASSAFNKHLAKVLTKSPSKQVRVL